MAEFETLLYEQADGVAQVTLNRPERLNAFNFTMIDELHGLWRALRFDDDVRVVVLTATGGRAFCTGIDRGEKVPQPSSPYMVDDPAVALGPKAADLWKPVIAAVNGMACAGAFYLLGESEFIVATEHATFFDPHVSYGMVSAYEPMHMLQRMPLGEVMRMSLLGNAERMSATRAYEIGLVSEVVPAADLLPAAHRAAATIASYPPAAVQGTVRAVWAARELARSQALSVAPHLVRLGNLPGGQQEQLVQNRSREWRTR
jgi:enoyl-CoA hydratase/carnithine racemase